MYFQVLVWSSLFLINASLDHATSWKIHRFRSFESILAEMIISSKC